MINNIWVLIAKKLNNEATPEELKELDELLRNDVEDRYPIALLESLLSNNKDIFEQDTPTPRKQDWENLKTRLTAADAAETPVVSIVMPHKGPNARVKKLIGALAIAASIILCKGIFILHTNTRPADKALTRIIAPAGAVSNILLPDGSKVVLNSGSQIWYSNSFDAEHRELKLSGEAYFEIVKDPRHPFVVNTSTIRIRVLGTKFNVRAYPNEKLSAATLLKGVIELTVLKNPDRQIILKPGEKLTVVKDSTDKPSGATIPQINTAVRSVELEAIHQNKIDSLPDEVLWIDDVIVFDGKPFEEVARMMERKYNVSIEFRNPKLARQRLTGKFQGISLEKALNQLQIIKSFSYQIKGNKVIIY